MSATVPRFSLLSLLLTMTLVAAVVGTWSTQPVIAVIATILAAPLMFVAAMAVLANRSSAWRQVVRVLVLAAAASIFCFLLWLLVS